MNAPLPALSRYGRRVEKNGTWTVFDAFRPLHFDWTAPTTQAMLPS